MLNRRDLMLGAAIRAFAQEPTFSTEVKVVTLLATVQNKDGVIVKDLNKEDFLVAEDGVPQAIQYFSRESDLPLTVGLLVDTSRSQAPVIDRERSASHTFLDQVLRGDKDQAFVALFDFRVQVLQDLTSSRTKLSAALDELKIPTRGSTLLYRAVRECSENQMRKQPGRKAFVILSDGVDVHSKTTIVTAIEFAQRADTIIYSILFNKWPLLAYYPSVAAMRAIYDARGRHAMQRLARETGGAYFQVSKDNTIERIYASIEEQLRNQYSIGYVPQRKDGAGRYRQIRLTTKQSGLLVQTRAGYYAQ
jgi:VWFA-related protein